MTDPAPVSIRRAMPWRLARPLALRLRAFLAAPLRDEIAGLRHEIAALRHELAETRRQHDEALEPRIAAVLEQAVLTLALDRAASRAP